MLSSNFAIARCGSQSSTRSIFSDLVTIMSSPGKNTTKKTLDADARLEWKQKKKEENKRQAESQLKEWINRMTIDHLLLSDDMTKVTEIDSQPVDNYNMVYLRALCIKLKVNGYKNKRREDMLQLLCYRKRIQLVESVHYPESTTTPARISATSASSTDDNNRDENNDEQQSAISNISSPETRSMARARLQAEEEAKEKEMEQKRNCSTSVTGSESVSKNSSSNTWPTYESIARPNYGRKVPRIGKSTPPKVVTSDGTYYRAINVWFDERNRTDIINMGTSPTMQELDSRQFVNKRTYDKLLLTYLDTSNENDAINFIGFGGNEYMLSCGIDADRASEFDVLTSEELKQVLDHVVYWYNVSLRNNRASGNHADFHQFVGCRPFVYYYHLWLLEIPHLSFLAVPTLDETVFRLSMDDEDETSATTPSEISNATKPKRDASSTRGTSYKRKVGGHGGKQESRNNMHRQQEEKKLKLLETHLKVMEEIEEERLIQRRQKDKLAHQLSLTSELKTIEEMLQMKRSELKDSQSSGDPQETKVVERHLKKLQKKRDRLIETVCHGFNSDSDDDGNSVEEEGV